MTAQSASADDLKVGAVGIRSDSEFRAALSSAELFRQLLATAAIRDITNRKKAEAKFRSTFHCVLLGAAAVLNKPLRLREYRDMLSAFERFWLGHVRLPSESA